MREKVRYKFWIELGGKSLIGKGKYDILKKVRETNSLLKASTSLGIPYRTTLMYVRSIEKTLGKKVVRTSRGGYGGGGKSVLTKSGEELLKIYETTEKKLKKALK